MDMKIDTMRVNNAPVESARWNGIYLYRNADLVFPDVTTWEYNAETADYPNTSDNTKYFTFTRNLLDSTSSKITEERMTIDTNGGYVYHLYSDTDANYAAMYFSFTIPANTSIKIDGLLGGFNGGSSATAYSRVYATTTKPTSGYYAYTTNSSGYINNADLILYNQENDNVSGSWYSGGISSSKLTEVTGTLTNNTNAAKTYYMVFINLSTYYVQNYYTGLLVKYLKFTKV